MHSTVIYTLKQYWSLLRKITIPLRRLIVKPLVSLPVSSEVIGPPRGFYNSTWDWIVKYESSKIKVQEATCKEIYPSHQISRLEPRTLDRDVHWKFKQEYQRESPATFVAVVPDGRIWGHNGTVISPDDKVLADVSVEFGINIPDDLSIGFQWKLPSVYHIEGKVAVLSAAGSEYYFHWMFDTLPRLELLRRSDICINSIDRFVVNSCHLPFHKATLTALGIPPTKIVELREFPHIKATQLVVPSLPGNTGNVPLWACNFLRQGLLPDKLVKKSDMPERIYITRVNARYRKIINEAELTNFLSQLGFASVVLESMPVVEQALLFSSVKVIVAPHGAGLTNIVFCKPGTKVIELFSPRYVNVCYWSLSNQIKLEYYYLLGEGQRLPEHLYYPQGRADIKIDIDSLSNLIKFAGVK